MSNPLVLLTKKIEKLKSKRNAVILAHNYQMPEVQDVADYVGDSLGLSQAAAKTAADVIVFCGVRFMVETASILCPDQIVLHPEINAGCPMANMITVMDVQTLRKKYPNAPVVCYVNTTAEVKAESNVCCTSSNAVKIVESLPSQKIVLIPDKYLAHYVSTCTDKEVISWKGFCPTHIRILPEDILKQKGLHPKAKVIVHPECIPPVIALADKVLSTSGMVRYAKESLTSEIIVGTEVGMLHRLRKENPQKRFYFASKVATCPNMKSITLEKIFWSLKDMRHQVIVPPVIARKAKKAIDKMLQFN